MKTLKAKEKEGIKKTVEAHTWEEGSGFLAFLSIVPAEVEKFNENFELGLRYIVTPPPKIDNSTELPLKAGFIVVRNNRLLGKKTYCLYSVLKDMMLHGYIGILENGNISTLKELKPIKNFGNAQIILYDWLRQLVRASCEKITI